MTMQWRWLCKQPSPAYPSCLSFAIASSVNGRCLPSRLSHSANAWTHTVHIEIHWILLLLIAVLRAHCICPQIGALLLILTLHYPMNVWLRIGVIRVTLSICANEFMNLPGCRVPLYWRSISSAILLYNWGWIASLMLPLSKDSHSLRRFHGFDWSSQRTYILVNMRSLHFCLVVLCYDSHVQICNRKQFFPHV